MMDGTMFAPVVTLGDVVETVMRQQLPFGTFRQMAYVFLKNQQCFLITADRIGEGGSYIILVTYYDADGVMRTESFDEWSTYTKAQPVSTW
jgi:hypothetical protein